MLVYALGIYDGPPERYETYTLSCPKGEACTVFIRTVDGDQGGLDTRTATMTVKVEDAFGQQVYTKAAEAWAFPQFSNDRTFNEFFDQLADLPDVEPSFIEHCRHRETAGRDEFGHAFLDRDNCLEGLEEAADLAIYSELHLLRCRREGRREQTELALEAARLAALAYVALARLHHAS